MADYRTILSGVVGSHAYGLATPESDIDVMSVFLGSEDTYLGVDYTNPLTKEVKGANQEETAYELRKFCMMCVKSNPNALPLLFLDKYETLEPAGQALLDIKHIFVTKDIVRTFGAFALSEVQKVYRTDVTGEMGAKRKALVEKHGYNTKSALHALRMARMCFELATNGPLEFNRFKAGDAWQLLTIKGGGFSKDDVVSAVTLNINAAKEFIKTSRLPNVPDKKLVNDVVKGIIKKYVIN